MSVRAYKIIEIQMADDSSFNCWRHPRVMNWGCDPDRCNDGGILDFEKAQLIEALRDEMTKPTDVRDAEFIQVLHRMITDCGREDVVSYYCY